jgi:hypothetical protein
MPLDLRRYLVDARTPLWEAWLAYLSQQAMGQPTYVLYDPHDGEAFIQLRYRPHQSAADVVFLAPGLAENPRAARAWSSLLDGACIEAACRGIQRVFASLPESGAEVDAFHQAGFALYTGEDLYHLAQPPAGSPGEQTLTLRPRRAEDWPRFQKLCVAITPQRVRQAEGGVAFAGDQARRCQWHVLEGDGGDLAAAVNVCLGAMANWLRLLVHPDSVALAGDLIAWGLAALDRDGVKPVYCHVRKFESGLLGALEEVGFELQTTRVLMVKHTLAWIKSPTMELAPALKGGAEPVPPVFHRTKADAHPASPDAGRLNVAGYNDEPDFQRRLPLEHETQKRGI